MTSFRESYRRRRSGSTLSGMFAPWASAAAAAEIFARQEAEFQEEIRAGLWGTIPQHWQATSEFPRYCWWCRSPLGPYESDMQGNPVCEECERWYEHAHCYWWWDQAEFWYPGWPVFHLPLCGRCSRRHLDGLRPPWYPNLLQRRELHVRWLFVAQARGSRYALPGVVCDLVAGFLAPFWRP